MCAGLGSTPDIKPKIFQTGIRSRFGEGSATVAAILKSFSLGFFFLIEIK
jgi:hypothetical protein